MSDKPEDGYMEAPEYCRRNPAYHDAGGDDYRRNFPCRKYLPIPDFAPC